MRKSHATDARAKLLLLPWISVLVLKSVTLQSSSILAQRSRLAVFIILKMAAVSGFNPSNYDDVLPLRLDEGPSPPAPIAFSPTCEPIREFLKHALL